MRFSVIIPTYKEPEYLDLCLRSVVDKQTQQNEVIVVVDGYYGINKNVLTKYTNYITPIILDENVGMIRAMNLGVNIASNEWTLHLQSDNVISPQWDSRIKKHLHPKNVVSINQVEPTPSMFSQFVIKNIGMNSDEFDSKQFDELDYILSENTNTDTRGNTFPFFIRKIDYQIIGGFDNEYPGPWVVDWDFFLKCKLAGYQLTRCYDVYAYHFVSKGTRKTEEQHRLSQKIENECHEYAFAKWGKRIMHDPLDNSKYLL